jgi:ABC-2 type transport system permease protein
MFHFVNYIRVALLYQQLPSLNLNIGCAVCALVSLALGYIVFKACERKFILYI